MKNRHPSSETSLADLSGTGPRVSSRGIPRRTVLRGAGLAVALPMLEAMMPTALGSPALASPTPESVKRLLYVYVPNGVRLDEWRQVIPAPPGDEMPEGVRRRSPKMIEGEHLGLDLPGLLAPLRAYREQLLLLRGLTADKARANGDGPGDHARASAAFLTGVQPLKTEGRVNLGISADQLAAREVGGITRIRSLALGLEPGMQSGQCDSGYACAYSGHVSWESATVPAAKETSARAAFDRLFRGGDGEVPEGERQRRLADRRSVLDFVREESKRLSTRVGAADRARLEEYETGLRELERQLSFDGAAHVEGVPEEARPDGESKSTFAEEARLFGKILALAFESDVTRIATFMFGNEGSGRRYHEIGVSEGHHTLSHHRGDVEKLAAIGKINGLHIAALAEFVGALASRRWLDGSLLDGTAIVYGSGIAEGDRHDHHDLPILVVGGKHLGIRGGRTLVAPRETPLNNLHAALLERLGVSKERSVGTSLGDATGILDGLG
ncbi:hypothetical protein Poly30_33210 [Planctomycetes bacterium Poly30]|uniref:DUF1552 domain-containing protein n=2 Tax=Saltatorellus ferox TaxID=2528018 RepID=A0A518EUR3_9BACT|nr:hypothetical protein Poly30_33210 [Planctomycetes bacterium Poly30]